MTLDEREEKKGKLYEEFVLVNEMLNSKKALI
jgi:hypothetical protein